MNNNPSILWAQDRTHLFITIEIHNFKNQEILFSDNNIKLDGSSGNIVYQIIIDLHSEIESEGSDWCIKQNKVELNVKKRKNIYWQKLTKNKQNNIKIDWQKWRDEDEEEEGEGLMNDFSNFTKQLPEEFLSKNFEDMIDTNIEGVLDEKEFDIEELGEEDIDFNNDNLDGDIDTEDNNNSEGEEIEYKKIGGIEVLENEELNLDNTNL